ncbi:MAG: 5'-nucleotidase C-terminal domain-containing protein [Lachnospiraceae bacterium]|nr:5'-nucleotidase C-terminal domain-containing protein [Lachnospiraceae bacterium]
MYAKKTVLAMTAVALMCLTGLHSTVYAGEKAADYTDVVILSTTDMHGKCWNTNVLTDSPQRGSMLRVSSAVSQIREEYGEENVLLVDNGDLFQGTPVSQIQLLRYSSGESTDPPAMALCLKEIGYDAFVLGNHEFNYDWAAMSAAYRWLEDNGVPVLAANVCYDGTDAEHAAGENAFTPYIIKTITVNGHEHKIGILGFENSDITRWDLPVNYPGLVFAHPGNDVFSMSYEAQLYIPKMQEEGCEFIIVSYHGGLGDTDMDLVFGINSEDQGKRMIEECEGIDLLIIGHDHSTGYSNTFETDRSGKEVLVVNGGGQELTRSVFRFSEDEGGALVWELAETENLVIDDFDTDKALEEKIRPYAELAEAVVEQPVGTAEGDWDKNSNFFTSQTDSIDLVSAAMMEIGTKRLQKKFGETGTAALKDAAGLDHLDVDMSMTSVTASGNYTICPGDISFKDIYRLYRYDNVILVLPMYGREILAVMEENAANRLAVREIWDEAYFYTHDDQFTNIVFGGLNFTYDMSKPAGERVQAEGFSNGRAFDENRLFLVVVNNYILGNERCGLREYGEEDAIWSQLEFYSGRFTTYELGRSGIYTFNLYEVQS